jgi:undecaprenyl-diphosphatase
VGQSILSAVAQRPNLADLAGADAGAVRALNRVARDSTVWRTLSARAAVGLARVEIGLMILLAARGGWRAAIRMVLSVALIYAVCEGLGRAWRRPRPFAVDPAVDALVAHATGRSFPSRHVASGLAMAVVGGTAHPALGWMMSVVAAGLGVSRVAAGLHYPSDVLVGTLLGLLVGRRLRP